MPATYTNFLDTAAFRSGLRYQIPTAPILSAASLKLEQKVKIPRAPRFDLHLPLRFFSSDGLATGHCVNVSRSGMLAMFDQPVDIWLEGELRAVSEEFSLSIRARVARLDGCDVGLFFRIFNERDELVIQRLLAKATEGGQAPM